MLTEQQKVAIGKMGMTEKEKEIVLQLADVWNKFNALPETRVNERFEFCQGINRLQDLVAARHVFEEFNAITYRDNRPAGEEMDKVLSNEQ